MTNPKTILPKKDEITTYSFHNKTMTVSWESDILVYKGIDENGKTTETITPISGASLAFEYSHVAILSEFFGAVSVSEWIDEIMAERLYKNSNASESLPF